MEKKLGLPMSISWEAGMPNQLMILSTLFVIYLWKYPSGCNYIFTEVELPNELGSFSSFGLKSVTRGTQFLQGSERALDQSHHIAPRTRLCTHEAPFPSVKKYPWAQRRESA